MKTTTVKFSGDEVFAQPEGRPIDGLLDDLVHAAKSGEASVINNLGWDEQVEYLIEYFGEQEALRNVRTILETADDAN